MSNGKWHHIEDIQSLDFVNHGISTTVDCLRELLLSPIAVSVNRNGLTYKTDSGQVVDFSEIDWVKFHYESKSFYGFGYRKDFRKLMEEQEKQTGNILNFEEYEIAFIKYLIEIQKVKPLPDILNF